MNDPLLRFTDGTKIVDILAPGSGWRMRSPYWNMKIAQRKGDGTKVNSAIAEGQRLVSQEYDNVIESIPLTAYGIDQNNAIDTINELLSLARQSGDYWAKTYEFDDVWMEVRPACNDALTGYARIIQMRIGELTNPFGQPFFGPSNEAVMEDITLIVEREPLWRALPPGEIIGPLYNFIKNPDFELWNFGVTDSQPDSWTDLETIQITGQNSQQSTAVHSGQYALKVRVSGSTLTGRAKGVTQIISNLIAGVQYTAVAWVRSDGVSNGVGRILITYSGSQLELYRSALQHGWTVYAGVFTAGTGTTAINCQILTTAANTDGTVYFDSLMIIPGNYVTEAENGTLPYLSGSHIANHWDKGTIIEAGDINYVDVWGVPGTEDALTRLEVQNNTTPLEPTLPVELFATVRVGMRRTNDIFNFNNYLDPPGIADTTSSSNEYVSLAGTGIGYTTIANNLIVSNIRDNEGRFRVLARMYDAGSNMLVRLAYFIGAGGIGEKLLNAITAPVSGQWFIANITPNAAMNWDAKFEASLPSQMGYKVQVSRATGSSGARLDYVMVMPTDGGYLEANLNPPISQGNALIADNTASLSIGATQLHSGVNKIFQTATTVVWIESFNGDIYLSDTGFIYSFSAGVWSSVSPTSGIIRKMTTYNGELYGCSSNGELARLRAGIWSVVATAPGSDNMDSIRAFNGLLFCPTTDGTDVDVYTWNNSSLTLNKTFAGHTQIKGTGIYNNRLLLATRSGSNTVVSEYNPTSGAWTTNTTISGAFAIESELVEFKGKLYGVSSTAPGLYVYDGSTWTSQTISGLTNLIVWNNKLYLTGSNKLLVSEDGVTFTQIYATITVGSSVAFAVANGALVFNVSTSIYVISEDDTIYKVANYQGTPFLSPPQKRHRFFFNVDRQNYINNIDDQMLIGIGFVPRYLGLRGRG
jgi:hypothetical protein